MTKWGTIVLILFYGNASGSVAFQSGMTIRPDVYPKLTSLLKPTIVGSSYNRLKGPSTTRTTTRAHPTSFSLVQASSSFLSPSSSSSSKVAAIGDKNVLKHLVARMLLVGALVFSVSTAVWAAPPYAVIAEELGYFPVTNSQGQTIYIPQPVKRDSSAQAMRFSKEVLKDQAGAVVAGTFWCPHTTRQKQLLGKQVLDNHFVEYVECAPQGYRSNPAFCAQRNVEGYPTWIFTKLPNQPTFSGEHSLQELEEFIANNQNSNEGGNRYGKKMIRPDLEENVPPPIGSGACNLAAKKK